MPHNPQEVEIEKTYLARAFPEGLMQAPSYKMIDVYVPEDSGHPQLRLRKKGDRHEITKKQPVGDDASHQIEQTIPLTEQEFASLSRASSRRIEKTRYVMTIDGHEAEIDVFECDLNGLVLIDFEFSSIEARDTFTPPACCLADVTHEKFIAGGLLAGRAYADIKPELDRFNYITL